MHIYISILQALVIAHERSTTCGALVASTAAILFFAVPNNGSGLGKPAYFVARGLALLGIPTNTRHLKLLAQESDELVELAHQFEERAKRLSLVIFFETSRLLGCEVRCLIYFCVYFKSPAVEDKWSNLAKVVSKASCGAGLPNLLDVIGIPDSDHRTICTYASIECYRYLLVSEAVKRVIKRSTERPSGLVEGGDGDGSGRQNTDLEPPTQPMHTTLAAGAPFPPQQDEAYYPVKYPSPNFVGREELLDQLAAFFAPRPANSPSSRREFILYGMGGVGKTQISLKFAELHSHL